MRSPRIAALAITSTLSLACIGESEAGPKTPKPAPNAKPIALVVDVRDAGRRAMHTTETIPVEPGPLVLHYPKWIPGEHGPTGAIKNLAGVTMRANGAALAWSRDPVDMYSFHVDVPAGATEIVVELDYVAPSSSEEEGNAAFSTSALADVTWHNSLLYPSGRTARDWMFEARLVKPKGWSAASSLAVTSRSDEAIAFARVTLEELIDSPVIVGKHFSESSIAPAGETTPHAVHVVADAEAARELPRATIDALTALVRETGALFGARHYARYDFLVTLSDHFVPDGLEHHQSSDNRVPERTFLDASIGKTQANLFAHEMTHSWNGKFRRPTGLATPDYQTPMKGDLLWIYEGLTEYYGNVLAARAGFLTPEDFREDLAGRAASLEQRPGRTWESLRENVVAAQLHYTSPEEWLSLRRGIDFYSEGQLVWLEVDATIRKLTSDARSLDDFCARFFGGAGGKPEVSTYTLDDVVKELGAVAPFDWKKLFEERLTSKSPRAPLGGIEEAGYRLVFSETDNEMDHAFEEAEKTTDLRYSIGAILREEKVVDVVIGSPAFKAGLGPGMKLVAVNTRKYKPEGLADAITSAQKTGSTIDLLVDNADTFTTVKIEYRGGARSPHLERDAKKADRLAAILAPRAPAKK